MMMQLQSDLVDEHATGAGEPRLRVLFYGPYYSGKSSTINSLARHFGDRRRLPDRSTTRSATRYYSFLPLDDREPEHSILLMDTAGMHPLMDERASEYLGALLGGLKQGTDLKDRNSYCNSANHDSRLKPHLLVLVCSAAWLVGPESLTRCKYHWLRLWCSERGRIDMTRMIEMFGDWFEFVSGVARQNNFRKSCLQAPLSAIAFTCVHICIFVYI